MARTLIFLAYTTERRLEATWLPAFRRISRPIAGRPRSLVWLWDKKVTK
ncbi:MAG TPA: hypothetical protein VLS25_01375 [Dehalococcoidia bacterium]|nr:hypothetical protein [Dehalococcoidia bacterium]